MTGNLYYEETEKNWYVSWVNNPDMFPSVPLTGR